MRLQTTQLPYNYQMVICCCWTPQNEVITCSDDQTIVCWRMDGEVNNKIATITDTYITSISWLPSKTILNSTGTNAINPSNDIFVISCVDGTFRIMTKNGREEKKGIVTENGAVIFIQWNYDGTAFVTGSEDGSVKIWSRNGNLRSTLAQISCAVYTVIWGPDNDQILFSNGSDLIIKTIQIGKKQLQWKAHAGVVTKVDWNPINNKIISAGEDRIYRVWDSFGRQLYQSKPGEYVITSISWNPHGHCFAVGSYNIIRLCDKSGWCHSREKHNGGSLMDIKWASDGTQLAGTGGNGSTIFATIVDRTLEWNNIEVTLINSKRIRVQDVLNETIEELEFERDRVIEMSLGYNYLIVVTSTQCFIYHTSNWNTPHIFDLRTNINLIIQSEKYFVMTSNLNGINVYSYDGRMVSSPKFPGLHVEFLNNQTLSISSDIISILDHSTRQCIRSFDILSGRPFSNLIYHTIDIISFSLSQDIASNERKLFFIDLNHDLYITPVIISNKNQMLHTTTTTNKQVTSHSCYKLYTQADTAAWNDTSEELVCIADGKFIHWSYPSIVFIDRSLLHYILDIKDANEFLKNPQIINYIQSKVMIRRMDGSIYTLSISPYSLLLYEFINNNKNTNHNNINNQWEKAIRLCRYVKNKNLWGCLTGMALYSNHLDTAEIALAALEEVDKLYFILFLKEIPSEEGRNAEIAFYKRNYEEAENILLQAQPPLIYRAIKINIRSFQWNKALDLAIKYKVHIDTVLAYRQQYLMMNKLEETDKNFIQYFKQVTIDLGTIAAKKKQERQKEKENYGRNMRQIK